MRKLFGLGVAALAALLLVGSPVRADLTEGFNTVTPLVGTGTPTQVTASGFIGVLRSTTLGASGIFQGNDTVFPAQAGPTTSYAGMNFQNTTGTNTISTWLLSPVFTLNNGDTMSFWTRTVDSPAFPDRLQVRMSTNGASTDVGATATSVGDFSTLMLDINPTYTTGGYPNAWQQFTVNVSGLGGPVSGRFAFRYFVENGGPTGTNSDYIGIDSFQYTSATVIPEPSTLALLGLGSIGLLGLGRRRK